MSTPLEKGDEFKSDRGVLVLKQTLGSDILQALFQFFKLAELHEPNNEVFKKAIGDILKTVQVWIHIPEFGKLKFALSGDQIFINDVRIRPKPRFIEKIQFLLKFLRRRRLVGFHFDVLPTEQVLEQILWILARTTAKTSATLQARLDETGIKGFRIESLVAKQDLGSEGYKSLATDLYDQLYAFVKTVFTDFEQGLKMKPLALTSIFDGLQLVDEADLISLFCLRNAQAAPLALPQVAVNSAFMLYAWGRSLGLPPGVYAELAGAGLAHPLAFVNSLGGRARDIRAFDQANLAYSNMERVKTLWPLTDLQRLAVLEWSIPFGKNGVYKLGDQNCYQHFFSRMLRVVSTFQQLLISQRNVRPEDAISRLFSADLQCDQTLVRLFIHWLGIYPVGSFVKLTSGEMGQICSIENSLLEEKRPLVSVYKDKDGNLFDTPKVIDLNELKEGEFHLGIQEGIAPATATVPIQKIAMINSLSLSVSE